MPIPSSSSRIPAPGQRKPPMSAGGSSSFGRPPPSSSSFGLRPPQSLSSVPRPHSWSPNTKRTSSTSAAGWDPRNDNNQESASQEDASLVSASSSSSKPRPGFRPMALSIQVPPVAAAPRFVPPSPQDDDAPSDTIRVVLRIRPIAPDAGQKQPKQRRCLDVAPDRKGVTLAPASAQEKRFGFDCVFPESSEQVAVFQNVGRAAVENALQGYNGSIFAYGQTGSGKTFTMLGGSGLDNAHELRTSPSRGLMPRIFDYLFHRLADTIAEKGADNLQASLSCSYLEIYNEKVFDLLEDAGSAAAAQPKSLREDSKLKAVYVDQLREMPIESELAAIEWLRFGSKNRHMAATDMNRESSRSHAVFTIKLVQTERTAAGVMITRRSSLHLIDLAGSEKQRQTHVEGQRLKEAAQINKSLSALGNVIMSLVDVSNGQKRHVHYRDSKLTFLLRDSLGGNAITSIIATISAEEKYFTETLSTLKFAQRAKFIKNKAVQNEDADSMVPILKLEIDKLRQEIAALRSASVSPSDSQAQLPPGQSTDPLHMQAQQVAQATPPKKNRWEPALEMMQKLLRASGAAAPVDLEGENSYAKAEPAQVRCDRLEMLLYRMICRLEEFKEIAFAPSRPRPAPSPRPSGLRMPSASMLQAPRKYGLHKASSAQQLEKKASTHTDEELEKLKRELEEMTAKADALASENSLLCLEICEFQDWKEYMESERASPSGNNELSDSSGLQEHEEPTAPMFVISDPNEELEELVGMYRSLFDEVKVLLDDKKPMLRAPRSPGSGSSVTGDTVSLSFASEDESDDQESVLDLESDVGVNQDEGDSEREMRRIHGLHKRLERKLEQYQEAIQRLEKELQATQDDLETSSAATKFAEFQLQQMRGLASDEASKRKELKRAMTADLSDLERSNQRLEEQLQLAKAEKTVLQDKYASALSDLNASKQRQDEEIKRLLEEKTALERQQELAQHEKEARRAIEGELAEARARIQMMENEARGDGLENAAPSNYKAQAELQRMLDAALADKAELLETIHGLQSRQAAPVPDKEGGREKELAEQVAALQQHVQRLEAARATESPRTRRSLAQLQQEQRKVKRLEEELTRTRSSSVSATFAPEFFCSL